MQQEKKLTPSGAEVIQRAHGYTIAHRAVIGTEGGERESKRAARKDAQSRLLSACDRDRRKGRP